MSFISVACGGAIGAMCRYAMSLMPIKTYFPLITLMTNVLGALLIGFIVGIVSNRNDISKNAELFWKTGLCGGFTTFSTFSLETLTLLEDKSYVTGGSYIVLSIICCLIGLACGRKLALIIQG